MCYSITLEDIRSITKPEEVFGTTRLLPAKEDIPDSFINDTGKPLIEMVGDVFADGCEFGSRPLKGSICIISSGITPEDIRKVTYAHLTSRELKHEDKVTRIAYMLSHIFTLIPDCEDASDDV